MEEAAAAARSAEATLESSRAAQEVLRAELSEVQALREAAEREAVLGMSLIQKYYTTRPNQ